MNLSKPKNINTLRIITSYKKIELLTREKEIKNDQIRNLRSPKNQDLYNYLRTIYEAERQKAKVIDFDEKTVMNNLSTYIVPDEYELPTDKSLRKQLLDHQKKAHKIKYTHKAYEDFEDLTDLLNSAFENKKNLKNLDLRNLKKFFNDKNHTYEFRKFAKTIETRWPIALLLTTKTQASSLARKHGISSDTFYKNLNKTFRVPKLENVISGINHDFNGRYSTRAKAAALTLLFASTSATGLSLAHAAQDKNITPTTTVKTQEDTQPKYPYDSKYINSYSEAKNDIVELTNQVYNNLTGENYDFSGLNISTASTPIYTVQFGDNIYQFSTMSSIAANDTYFNETINNLGGKIIDITSKEIAFAKTHDDRYAAISDSDGISIKDGNILFGQNEQYNPRLLNQARELIESNPEIIYQLSAQGIDANNLSDSQLMGVYLFYNSEQDENLAQALGETFELNSFIKNHINKDTRDNYTFNLYSEKSNRVREKIYTNYGLDKNTQDNSKATDNDGFEPGDDF